MVLKKFFKILRSALGLKKRHSRRRKKARKKIKRIKRIKRSVKKRRSAPKKKQRTARTKSKRQTRKRIDKSVLLGEITHYYPNVRAAVVKLKKSLSIGEPIHIKGKLADFRQTVGSIQIDRKPIEKGRPGQEIGLEVFRDVRPGDLIYRS